MQKPDWVAPLFPWQQHAVTVNGRRMSYIDEGPRDGRPVLLLSGNPTWGFLYRDFIAPLSAAGFRAIAPDWVGASYSDHPRVDAALTLCVSWLPDSGWSPVFRGGPRPRVRRDSKHEQE